MSSETNAYAVFKTKVVGVTFQNPDGKSRQLFIKKLRKREQVFLIRDYNNENDKYAIAVYDKDQNPLGYLPSDDLRLANHIDKGGTVNAKVIKVTGGKSLINKVFGMKGKNYGLVLLITKLADYDWEKIRKIEEELHPIQEMIQRASREEKLKPKISIDHYHQAITDTINFESKGIEYKACRHFRIPIDRITMVLEKEKRFKEALDLLKWYNDYDDYYGITSESKRMIEKRYERLKKKA